MNQHFHYFDESKCPESTYFLCIESIFEWIKYQDTYVINKDKVESEKTICKLKNMLRIILNCL